MPTAASPNQKVKSYPIEAVMERALRWRVAIFDVDQSTGLPVVNQKLLDEVTARMDLEAQVLPTNNTPGKLKLVAVTDEVARGAVGTITYWKLPTTTDAAALKGAWEGLELQKVLGNAPMPPTPDVAISRATADQKQKRRLVRPLAKAKEGYAIVRETVIEGKDPEYEVLVKVKLNAALKPVFDPTYSELAVEIREAYKGHLETIVADDLSSWLTTTMTKLKAVMLKPSGGIYFVPQETAGLLEKVVRAVRSVGIDIYEVPAMESEKATLAFVDALSTEVRSTYETMLSEIEKGTLGVRALETRSADAKKLATKIGGFGQLLGVSFEDLKQMIVHLDGVISAASLAASTD